MLTYIIITYTYTSQMLLILVKRRNLSSIAYCINVLIVVSMNVFLSLFVNKVFL